MEELAVRQMRLEPSGGVLFARHHERDSKDVARQAIVDLFHPQRWPGHLHMLTMPGLHWRFERLMLAMRHPGWMQTSETKGTFFTSIESDRSIYFAAVAHMPGVETRTALIKPIKPERVRPFAEMGVKTRCASFFFANIDDLMQQKTWDGGWDAAWLDYTGPLTVERLELIQTFFHTYVRDTLIVTAMKARWNRTTSTAIDKADGYSQWLRQSLFGEILHDIEYFDTVPMAQFAVRHPNDLGQSRADAQTPRAEIAAAGHEGFDARTNNADGGTYHENLGPTFGEARTSTAEIAAAGRQMIEPQWPYADGGPNPRNLGHQVPDTQSTRAEIAAAGQRRFDAPIRNADGGTNPKQRRNKKWQKRLKQTAKPRPKKRGSRSESGSRPKSGKPSRAAKPRHQPLRKKQRRLSVKTKTRAKSSARARKQ
jgi:hypothetical protein